MEQYKVQGGSTPGGARVTGQSLVAALPSGLTTLLFGANNTTSAYGIPLSPISIPRLASIALTYEFYKFHNCKVKFQSNQPTTAGGVVELAVDHDGKDTAPTTSIAMMRNISSAMANVYSDLEINVPGSLARLPKYIVSSDASSDLDQLYQGIVYTAFEGVVGTNAAQGYLLIQYDIEFFTPQ